MRINIKTKIWFSITGVVMILAYFLYFYFPEHQREHVLENYEKEVQVLANTIALVVEISMEEQNLGGIQEAMNFVTADPRFSITAIITTNEHGESKIWSKKPENYPLSLPIKISDSLTIKFAKFETDIINGKVLVGFSNADIHKKIDYIQREAAIEIRNCSHLLRQFTEIEAERLFQPNFLNNRNNNKANTGDQ